MSDSLNAWIGIGFLSGLAFYTAKAWITEIGVHWWRRRYAGYVADMTARPVTTVPGPIALLHPPFVKKWQEVYEELPADCEIRWMSQKEINKNRPAVMEYLFFAYYGPLEAWCEKHLQGSYILWYDEKRIQFMMLEERDCVFWYLKWGKKMPSYSALDKAT